MSTIKANAILDASGGNTVTINSVTPTAYNTMGKNRIINGAMEIDQRGLGTTTINSDAAWVYTLDRWSSVGQTSAGVFTVQQSSTAPVGFTKSFLSTVTTSSTPGANALYIIRQVIEGYNCADLAWGTSDAKTITFSFYVRSSVTGTFGGVLKNSAENRSYAFTYTVSSANTWEKKSVTIAGDTSGTWLTTNGAGMNVYFSLGAGSSKVGTAGSWTASNLYGATGQTNLIETSGATLYITGVQLEAGSVATEFERRPYTTELQLCQRYYCKTFNIGTTPANNAATEGAFMLGRLSTGDYEPSVTWRYPVEMRVGPTITLYNPESGTSGQWSAGGGTTSSNARSLFIGTSSAVIDNTDVAITGAYGWRIQATASAEL